MKNFEVIETKFHLRNCYLPECLKNYNRYFFLESERTKTLEKIANCRRLRLSLEQKIRLMQKIFGEVLKKFSKFNNLCLGKLDS